MLVGLSCSVWIYLTAGEDPATDMVDEFLNSKKHTHELAIYGGRLTVLADGFYRWFDSVWHGRQLAFTVAFGTAAISPGLCLVARHLQKNKGTEGTALP
jgi:hypothetical protein